MEELAIILNTNLVNLVVRKIVKNFVGRWAFLAWGPIGYIVEKCLRYIVELSYSYAELFVTDKIVDKAVDKDVSVVDKVTDKLIEYEENVENYSKEELDDLDEDLMAAYRDLFRF